MTGDPQDYVYIDAPVPGRGLRERRRQLTLTDADWTAVGDPTAIGGADGRLHAEISVNKVVVVIEVVPADLIEQLSDPTGANSGPRGWPSLRIRGRQHVVVGLFAA